MISPYSIGCRVSPSGNLVNTNRVVLVLWTLELASYGYCGHITNLTYLLIASLSLEPNTRVAAL
jgi:hypothetical protein